MGKTSVPHLNRFRLGLSSCLELVYTAVLGHSSKLKLLSLMHQGLASLFSTKWPLELASQLEARNWPCHIAKLDLVSLLNALLLAHSLLEQRVSHDRGVVHRAPTYISKRMADFINGSDLHWLEPAQHLSSLEHIDEFNAIVTNFLSKQI